MHGCVICVFDRQEGRHAVGAGYIVYVYDLYGMQRYTNLSGLFGFLQAETMKIKTDF